MRTARRRDLPESSLTCTCIERPSPTHVFRLDMRGTKRTTGAHRSHVQVMTTTTVSAVGARRFMHELSNTVCRAIKDNFIRIYFYIFFSLSFFLFLSFDAFFSAFDISTFSVLIYLIFVFRCNVFFLHWHLSDWRFLFAKLFDNDILYRNITYCCFGSEVEFFSIYTIILH